MAPEHGFHPGLAHSAPGFPASLGSSPNPGQNSYLGLTPPAAPGSGPGHIPSSTEMQLRRVLHEIRGTVQSLSQVGPLESLNLPQIVVLVLFYNFGSSSCHVVALCLVTGWHFHTYLSHCPLAK